MASVALIYNLVHSSIEPQDLTNPDVINKYKDECLLFGCVDYICKTKKGHFSEHSNVLWNISGVPHWGKVHQGLIKMYKAEVLNKFPIMQHTLFGSLLLFEKAD